LIALLACPLFVPNFGMTAAILDPFVYLFMPTVYVIRLSVAQYTRVGCLLKAELERIGGGLTGCAILVLALLGRRETMKS
jgi:hypothetical protein